jgi:hypothetical protein
MHIELLPGQDNVVRFPVELRARPSMGLVREIAPDSREVGLAALSFGVEEPAHDLRHRVDRDTAEHIMNVVAPEPGEARRLALEELLSPLVKAAVEACRASGEASRQLAVMQQRALEAQTVGSPWAEQMGERADEQSHRAVELLLEAHARCEEAEGAARAVGMALRGETWVPYDPREAGEWLASGGGQ